MNAVKKPTIFLCAVLFCTCLFGQDNAVFPRKQEIDPKMLKKIRPLYPGIGLKRQGGNPFFSDIRELKRVRVPNGKERLVVAVGWNIPAALVDHGGGDTLIYEDARDSVPFVKLPDYATGGDVHIIQDKWIQFGDGHPLTSLSEMKSLQFLKEHGEQALLAGLSVLAVRNALEKYQGFGKAAFLQLAPIREYQEPHITGLPDRIQRAEIYPMMNEDFRDSGFKYYDSWEGTVFVRLIPIDDSQPPVILEMGANGASLGIDTPEVKLLIFQMLKGEPTDRPPPFALAAVKPGQGKLRAIGDSNY